MPAKRAVRSPVSNARAKRAIADALMRIERERQVAFDKGIELLRGASLLFTGAPHPRAGLAAEVANALVHALQIENDPDYERAIKGAKQWARGRAAHGARAASFHALPGPRAEIVRDLLDTIRQVRARRHPDSRLVSLLAPAIVNAREELGVSATRRDVERRVAEAVHDATEKGVRDEEILLKWVLKACGLHEDPARNVVSSALKRPR